MVAGADNQLPFGNTPITDGLALDQSGTGRFSIIVAATPPRLDTALRLRNQDQEFFSGQRSVQ